MQLKIKKTTVVRKSTSCQNKDIIQTKRKFGFTAVYFDKIPKSYSCCCLMFTR